MSYNMKVVETTGFVFVLMFISVQAAVIGDKTKQNHCFIAIKEDWHGLCRRGKVDKSCTYIPSPGWAIIGSETVITSKNNGWYKTTQISSTENELLPLDEAQQVFMALLLSGDIGSDSKISVANLSVEYTLLRNQVPVEDAAFQVHIQVAHFPTPSNSIMTSKYSDKYKTYM